MEESLTNIVSPINTSGQVTGRPIGSCTEARFRTSITSRRSITKRPDQTQPHLPQTEVYNDKGTKPFLIHKRRLSNNNTLLGLDNNDNASTDNQDESYKIEKNHFKKIQNSYILKDFEVLYSFFPFEVEFRLLYRASDHHFSTQKFHELCDYQTNTLTICKTKSNQIIGGYTPLPWAQDFEDNRTFFKTDKDHETFLFNINKKEKYVLAKAKRNKAICCFKGFGPTFGGGYDLQIGNRADQSYSSASYFPRSFACESKMATQKHLTGSKNKEFKILEWEVYKVVKKKTGDKREKRKSIQDMKTQETQSSFLQTIKIGLEGLFFKVKQKHEQGQALFKK